MKYLKAANINEALESFAHYRRWKPFESYGIKYLVQVNNDTFKALCSKPRKLKEGEKLYEIVEKIYVKRSKTK